MKKCDANEKRKQAMQNKAENVRLRETERAIILFLIPSYLSFEVGCCSKLRFMRLYLSPIQHCICGFSESVSTVFFALYLFSHLQANCDDALSLSAIKFHWSFPQKSDQIKWQKEIEYERKVKEKSVENLKSGNAHNILRFFLRLFSGLSSDLDATYNVAVSVCKKKTKSITTLSSRLC